MIFVLNQSEVDNLRILNFFEYINSQGVINSMDYLDKVIEKLKDLARKVIETLLGPQAEPETELIPIPVEDHPRRRYR